MAMWKMMVMHKGDFLFTVPMIMKNNHNKVALLAMEVFKIWSKLEKIVSMIS